MGVWWYAARRLLLMIPVVIGILVLTFAITHIIPRNPVYALLGTMADAQLIEDTIARLGLDQPLPVQFWRYVSNLTKGDLGTSIRTGRPVLDELVTRIPATLELTTLALFVAVVAGILVGTLGALREGKVLDHASRFVVLAGNSLPDFWIGLLMIFVFYVYLGWAPSPIGRLPSGLEAPYWTGFYVIDLLVAGQWGALRSALGQLALPVLTLAISITSPIARVVRAELLDVLKGQYIRAANAHGVRRQTVFISYALKNALLPLVTLIATMYGNLLGGAVMIETVFAWPGVGQWAADAVLKQDYPSVQAFVLVVATFYMVVYLLADILSAVVDPRLRH